jgi:hypothetical protein
MDARPLKFALLLSVFASMGATFRTPNFVVNAPDADTAKQVAQTAERCRVELAKEWLGHTLPNWTKPCDVNVHVGQVGAGGATKFAFDRGEVFGWNMQVQGTLERILDSVIPHEVSHTIFACYFRRPLPRWADEGAATLVEHESERQRQILTLKQVFDTPRRIPLKKLLTITEYPADMKDVLTLYAQGYSLADFLVQLGGKKEYLDFLNDAFKKNWDVALKKHYNLENVGVLEQNWSRWVIAGSPELLPQGQQYADARKSRPQSNVVYRSQAPDSEQDSAPPKKESHSEQRNPREKNAVASGRDSNREKADFANSAPPARLPRPKSLVLRQTFSPDDESAAPVSGRQNVKTQKATQHDLQLPTSDNNEFQDHPAEEQELSSSRHPDWSDFPRHQTRDGLTRLANASGMSDSP